jgi:hypothetical protein
MKIWQQTPQTLSNKVVEQIAMNNFLSECWIKFVVKFYKKMTAKCAVLLLDSIDDFVE